MAASDLHLLVHQLDKPERDRVKANAKRSKKEGRNVYIDLFEDLLKTATYTSDKAFTAAHKNASYVKSFAKIKSYLFDVILDALRSHRQRAGEERPKEFQIRELIEESQILRAKMLFGPSFQHLEKAKTEAEASQYYELLLETLKLMRTHLSEQGDINQQEQLKAVLRRIGEVGALINLNCQLMLLRDGLFALVRKNMQPTQELNTELENSRNELFRLNALESTSIEAKTNHYLTLALYHWVKGDLQDAWRQNLEVHRLWREARDFAIVRQVQHIKLLNNFLTITIAARQTTDFIDALNCLEKQATHSEDAASELQQNAAYIRLQYFLSRADWNNALQIEKAFKEKPKWVTNKTATMRMQMFYLSFARLHFVLENFKLSFRYLRRFEEERKPDQSEDKYAEMIMLRVLLYYSDPENCKPSNNAPVEMGNAIRAARRALAKLQNPAPYLDVMLKSMNNVLNLLEPQQAQAWGKLRKTVEQNLKNPAFDSASQLFLAWLHSKATGEKIQEILKADFPVQALPG